MTQKFFKILAAGDFAPGDITTRITKPGATTNISLLAQQFIEGGWQRHLALGNKPWPGDLKASRFRLAGHTVVGGQLQLVLDPCVTYKDYLGSNCAEYEKRFGSFAVPNALAITVLIQTGDGKTMLTLRNMKTDYKPGGWHASTGGFMNIGTKTLATSEQETPAEAGLRELFEESGVRPDEVEEYRAMSLVYNPWTVHTDLVLRAKTKLTAAEIIERPHDDENELLFIETTPESYDYWIKGGMHANVIIAMAAMIGYGAQTWGSAWEEQILAALGEGSCDYDDPVARIKLEKDGIKSFAEMVGQAGGGIKPKKAVKKAA